MLSRIEETRSREIIQINIVLFCMRKVNSIAKKLFLLIILL
jgi:hypothetical protein